eukprot:scaffold64677_cov30-Tisochrysis_lutea.AAC.1
MIQAAHPMAHVFSLRRRGGFRQGGGNRLLPAIPHCGLRSARRGDDEVDTQHVVLLHAKLPIRLWHSYSDRTFTSILLRHMSSRRAQNHHADRRQVQEMREPMESLPSPQTI